MATTPKPRLALMLLIAMFVCILAVAEFAGRADRDTADTRARDPVQLKITLHECWTDPARLDDKICAAASEAWRRRFFEYKKMGEPWRSPEASAPPHRPAPPELPTEPPAEPTPTPWMAGS